MNGEQLAAPEGVFEAIPELEFDHALNLVAEAGHDQWRTSQVPLQSRSRNWSLIRPWGCKSALRKWHMRRSVGESGAGAGRVR